MCPSFTREECLVWIRTMLALRAFDRKAFTP